MHGRDNTAVVRRWMQEGWSEGNLALVDELYSPRYVPRWLPPGFPSGREGLKQFVAAFRAGMPDLRFRVEDVVAEGDTVAFRFTARGTHRGELMGAPATGTW